MANTTNDTAAVADTSDSSIRTISKVVEYRVTTRQCAFCGEDMEVVLGRGRTKTMHKECSQARSILKTSIKKASERSSVGGLRLLELFVANLRNAATDGDQQGINDTLDQLRANLPA